MFHTIWASMTQKILYKHVIITIAFHRAWSTMTEMNMEMPQRDKLIDVRMIELTINEIFIYKPKNKQRKKQDSLH